MSTDRHIPQRPGSGKPEADLNWFTERERGWQERFRGWRDRTFSPLVRAISRAGVTSNQVSGLALGMLAPFGLALWYGQGSWGPIVAALSLVLHVLLDGLDGPLARAAGSADRAGAVTDMCFDHTGFLIVCVLLAASGRIDGAAACAYAGSYSAAIAMIVALNLVGHPLRFAVRTKYPFYLAVLMQELAGVHWLTPVTVTFSLVQLAVAIVGFSTLRRALRDPSPEEAPMHTG